MISLKYTKLSEAEKTSPYTYGLKKNKKILKKIDVTLPELITRSIKLCQELRNKILVSNFMNQTETKTTKYLTQIISSSRKRVKDIKTGLSLGRVVKNGTKNLSTIYNNINKDKIVKNTDFLINEKNLISEKINEREYGKINELIKKMKCIIQPTKLKKKVKSHKLIKSISVDEMPKIKNIITNQLTNDENLLYKKITLYKNNLLTFAENNSKNFYKLSKNIQLNSNLKMINYAKPNPISLQEKKISTLLKIRKQLSNTNKDIKINETERIDLNTDDTNLLSKNENNKNETMIIIKNFAKDKRNLEEKTKFNLKRINSMLDIQLPYYSNYHRTIKFRRKFNSISDEIRQNKKEIKSKFLFKNDDVNILQLIKDEIRGLTREKIKERYNEIENNKYTSQS